MVSLIHGKRRTTESLYYTFLNYVNSSEMVMLIEALNCQILDLYHSKVGVFVCYNIQAHNQLTCFMHARVCVKVFVHM